MEDFQPQVLPASVDIPASNPMVLACWRCFSTDWVQVGDAMEWHCNDCGSTHAKVMPRGAQLTERAFYEEAHR